MIIVKLVGVVGKASADDPSFQNSAICRHPARAVSDPRDLVERLFAD
jgi:hypothetical protein